MAVKAKAGTEEFDPIAQFVYDRWQSGKGVCITGYGGNRIYLIPENICDDKGSGLIITAEKGGSFVFRGERELNKFILAAKGFSLLEADEISKIVNALIKHFKWNSGNSENVAMPQIANRKGD